MRLPVRFTCVRVSPIIVAAAAAAYCLIVCNGHVAVVLLPAVRCAVSRFALPLCCCQQKLIYNSRLRFVESPGKSVIAQII